MEQKRIKVRLTKNSPYSDYGYYEKGDIGYIDGYVNDNAVIILENGKFAKADLRWIEVVNEEDKNVNTELAEGEDGRIRKALLEMVHDTAGDSLWVDYNVHKEDALAWLEKQGHNSNYIHITQTIIDYINRNKEKFENDIPKLGDIWKVKEVCTYSYVNNGKPVVEIENSKGAWMRLPLDVVNIMQGGSTILSDSSNIGKDEQKPVPKFKVGDTMRTLQEAKDGWTDGMPFVVSIDSEYYNCNSEKIAIKDQDEYEYPPMNRKHDICVSCDEQKPAWSEDDENFLKTALWHISYSISKGKSTDFHCDTTDWLKSLKDRVQPQTQQEWSEEDEKKVNGIITILKPLHETECDYNKYKNSLIAWLKSIRPQNRWKPSEEQIKAISEAIYIVSDPHIIGYPTLKENLESLLEQLKKLKK